MTSQSKSSVSTVQLSGSTSEIVGDRLAADRGADEVPGPDARRVGAGDPAELAAAPGQAAQELQVRRALEQRVPVRQVAGRVVDRCSRRRA